MESCLWFKKVTWLAKNQPKINHHPFDLVWLPNIIFGVLAIYLVYNAKK
jgi:hypothetical protein